MPIIIIGMHRSGTSMITRLLHTCGLYLGASEDYLFYDSEDNRAGYWEHISLVKLNDDILSDLGGSWYDPPKLQAGWTENTSLQPFAHRFDNITAEFHKYPHWGWKDPRNSLTLGFWLKHVPNLKVLLCLRNPLEVADSLSTGKSLRELKRNDALRLWGKYHKVVLQQNIIDRLVITHYESYFYKPEAELRRILNELGMTASDDEIATALSTIDTELKRQHVPESLLSDESELANVHQDYMFLCARAGDVFQELRSDLDYLLDRTNIYTTKLYNKTLRLSEQSGEQKLSLAGRDLIIEQQQISLADRDLMIEQQQISLAGRDLMIEQQQISLADRDLMIEQQHMSLADRNILIEQQRQSLVELNDRTEALLASLEVWPQLNSIALQGYRYRRLHLSKIFKVAGKLANFWSIKRVTWALEKGRLRIPTLFNAEWYLNQYPDVQKAGMHPYVHFWLFGWYQGYQPMPLFDINWYVTNYPHFNNEWANPLEHYESIGQYNGHRPCALFDPDWYLSQYPDVEQAGVDPLYHYCYTGWREGRNPSPEFDTNRYLSQNPDIESSDTNPLAHYLLQYGHSAKRVVLPLSDSSNELNPLSLTLSHMYIQEIEDSFLKSSNLSTYQPNQPRQISYPAVKLIAVYLPQFHPTTVNDEFWGKGFTEWTNVIRTRPLFKGHYQPRLPGELGFYDLRVVDTLREQARLAKQHGIVGFCIYRYWFNGKTVLDAPLELLYQHQDIDIDYCLCWANENWTRRWDGREQEILLAQEHTPEDDILFIADAERFFRDERYIRIDNKPVLIIYNASKLPDSPATAQRWRAYCKENGYPGLYLILVATFDTDIVSDGMGFDAVMQMPPHGTKAENIAQQGDFFVDFQGGVYDYDAFANSFIIPNSTPTTLFRAVSPDWDNSPRRGKSALIVANATAEKYKYWLRSAVELTLQEHTSNERLVFINAWNEWAEGAYLEPDRKYGYTTLNTTSKVLSEFSSTDILILAPNAARAGSQIVLLHLIEWLIQYTFLNVKVILEQGGILLDNYDAVAHVLVIDNLKTRGLSDEQIIDEIRKFGGKHVSLIYNNTCVSGELLKKLPYSAPVISHIHELEMSIQAYCADSMTSVCDRTNHFIAVAPSVAKVLHEKYAISHNGISIVNEFIVAGSDMDHEIKKQELIGHQNKLVVWGCGTVSLRKGFDIFINVAKQVHDMGMTNVQFCWMGYPTDDFPNVTQYIHQQGAQDIVTYLGEKENPRDYFAIGDLFFLSSREDPHPLVVLEAADCNLPTVCFADTGGTPAFVSDDAGVIVSKMDESVAAKSIVSLLQNGEKRRQLGHQARKKLLHRYNRDITAPYILETIRRISGIRPHVTVIVPAYNHASYLRQRLDSIYKQTFQDFEVILLDDASGDETSAILREYAEHHANTKLIINDANTGSTFSQWIKGLKNAQSDIIWIAEDDDFCEPKFLEKLLPYFSAPEVKLAYCQSYAIDHASNILFSYQQYTNDLSAERWLGSYVTSAQAEVNFALAKKNTIPNASGVLFRKFDFEKWAAEWDGSRLVGDWAFYLYAMYGGKVAFHSEILNYHRRHDNTNIKRYETDEKRFIESINAQRIIIQLYNIEPNTYALMRQGSLENWKEVYPDRTEAEFDRIYQLMLHEN